MLDDTTDEDEEEVAFVGEYNGERNERKQRHGQGITILPNGDRYKGQYVRNLRDGQGLYVFKGGARYEGAWRFGRKHGKGKFTYPDGSIYEGNWVNDKRYGYGIYHYQNGDMYLGQWKYGERSGYGYYLFKDSQAKYVGYWENGRRQGRGEILFGAYKYSGVFQSDSPVGPGRFIFLGGWEQQGHFIPFRAEPHVSSLVQRGQLDDEPDWPADGIPDVATTWIAERTVPSKEPAKHIKMEELMAKFDVTLTLKPPTGGATGSPTEDLENRLAKAKSGESIFK